MALKNHKLLNFVKRTWYHLDTVANESKILIKTFGIYNLLNSPISCLFWVYSDETAEAGVLRFLCFLFSVPLAFVKFWPKRLKKFIAPYWYFAIFFCLPFFDTYMFIDSYWSVAWLTNTILVLFFLILITDYLAFIIILPLGVASAFIVYYLINGKILWNSEDLGLALINYIWSIIIGTIFAKRKEVLYEDKMAILKALGGSIAHELRTPLAALRLISKNNTANIEKLLKLYHSSQIDEDSVDSLSPKDLYNIEQTPRHIDQITKEAFMIIDMLLTKLKKPSKADNDHLCDIRHLTEEAVKKYPLDETVRSSIILRLSDNFHFYGNTIIFLHVIFNLMKNALYHVKKAEKGEIVITSRSFNNCNKLYFRDTGKGIPKEILEHLFEKFYSNTTHGTGLGLVFCKLAMENLGGSISCNSIYGKYTEFVLEFPLLSDIKNS